MQLTHNQPSAPPPSTILRWLAFLHQEMVTEYAEKKTRHRSPQTGQAWRAFNQIFGGLTVPQLLRVVTAMLHFTQEDDILAQSLRNSLAPLLLEHELSGDFLGPNTAPRTAAASPSPLNGERAERGETVSSKKKSTNPWAQHPQPDPWLPESQAAPLLRRTVERWCDWLDADIHLHAHRYWHHSPVCFDPDPEKRHLACLGRTQRHFASQPDSIKAQWQTLHSLLAEHFKNSPKWNTVGQAMMSDAEHPWLYPEADSLIISLWPLVKRHHWTYRDLRNVALSLRSQHHPSSIIQHPVYPWRTDADLATFTLNTLALRKPTPGKTTKSGHPPGEEIARLLFARPQSPDAP